MSSDACDAAQKELWSLVDETRAEPDPELLRHVRECPRCGERLAELERLHSGLEQIGQAASPALPESIGPYRILRVIGEGGMGLVYEAEQESPARRVALKIIRPVAGTDEGRLRAFRREIQALGRLDHPSIATVFDAGRTEDGQLYLVMQRVEGVPLDRYARGAGARRSLRGRVELVAQLAEAVHHAHQRGVIHRDLKPANVLVDERGCPHVLDFGLARFLDPEQDVTFTLSPSAPAGTLAYMSPEQLEGDDRDLDVRTDVYALGVMLYHLLTGRLPYESPSSLTDAVRKFGEEQARHPRAVAPGVPRELGDVALKALARDRQARYASAAALADDLRRFLSGEAVSARPPSLGYHLRVLARRHKVLVTVVLALLAVPVVFVEREVAARARDRRENGAALARAGELLERYGALHRETGAQDGDLLALRESVQRKFLSDEETARLEELERSLPGRQFQRQRLFEEIRGLIQRAAQEPRLAAAIRQLEIDLYVERVIEIRSTLGRHTSDWAAFRALRDEEAHYLALAEEIDPDNPSLRRLDAQFDFRFYTDPAGAAVHVFRYENLSTLFEDGEDRLVPVPFRAEAHELVIRPGTWALEVVEPGAPLERGDLVVELAGHALRDAVFVAGSGDAPAPGERLVAVAGEPVASLFDARRLAREPGSKAFRFARRGGEVELEAEALADLGVELVAPRELARRGGVEAAVLREGTVRRMTLPRGLGFRPTATPLITGPQSLAGETPLPPLALPPGPYLLLIRRTGSRDVRYFLSRDRTQQTEDMNAFGVELGGEERAPPGFVPVVQRFVGQGEEMREARFWRYTTWVQAHEVTCGQYLEFLNDPETRASIEASSEPILFPRHPANARRGGVWLRAEDGRFVLPPGEEPSHPVIGVSWHDAKAYAAWTTRRARELGSSLVFDLPTREEWQDATVSPGYFVWGNSFRPSWTKSCFARAEPGIEPVMSYPIDRSPAGVYDVSGSAAEWLDLWLSEDLNHRRIVWGSWGEAGASWFHPLQPKGREPHEADDTFGFRLVARRPADSWKRRRALAPVSGWTPPLAEPAEIAWAEVLEREPDPVVVTDAAGRRRMQATGLPWRVRDRRSGIELVLVPPGEYLRGRVPGDYEALGDEVGRHLVRVQRPFYMGVFEVSVEQWRAFVEEVAYLTDAERAGGGYIIGEHGSWELHPRASWRDPLPNTDAFEQTEGQPVTQVSQNDSAEFCRHYGFRLPTEAQWEYACRAGTNTVRWWGDSPDDGRGKGNYGNAGHPPPWSMPLDLFDFDDGARFAATCGSYVPNPWGLHDMLGNVAEWCSNRYEETFYLRCLESQPIDEHFDERAEGERASARGGSWHCGQTFVRSSARSGVPDMWCFNAGFRVSRRP